MVATTYEAELRMQPAHRTVKWGQCKSPRKPIGTRSPTSRGSPRHLPSDPTSFSTPPSCHPRRGESWRSDIAILWKIAVPVQGENPLESNNLIPKPRPGLPFTSAWTWASVPQTLKWVCQSQRPGMRPESVRIHTKCLAPCLTPSKGSVMLLPLEMGTLLFNWVFWSDNSEAL